MHITLKKHPYFFDRVAPGGYYAVPIPRTEQTVVDHITAWAAPGASGQHRAYANLLATEQCYKIICKKNYLDNHNFSMPIPESHILTKDTEDKGELKQITNGDGLSISHYRGVLAYAKTIHVCLLERNRYGGHTYMITDGPAAGARVDSAYLGDYNESLVNPWKEVVGKVLSPDEEDVLSYCVGHYLYFAKKEGATRGYIKLAQGCHQGTNIAPRHVQFAESEEEKAIFLRKVVPRYQLLVGEQVKPTLNSLNTPFRGLLTEMQGTDSYATPVYNYSAAPTNYWDLDPKDYKRVTFLPQSKVAGVLEKGLDPWDCPQRQSTTWAKLLRMQVNTNRFTNEPKFENFGTNMVAALSVLYGPEEERPQMLVVSGEDIAKYYSQEYYIEKVGNLGGSCMRHVSPGFFNMYTMNPENISMLIIKDRQVDKIYGRAILWKSDEGVNYIDRRYTTNSVEEQKMMLWAEKNGYVDLWGGHHSPKAGVKVTLKNPYHKKYPYMDSMCHLDVDSGVLSSQAQPGKKCAMVKDTGGNRTTFSHEVQCAVSEIVAPQTAMAQAVSGKFAFPQYLETIRGGRLELKAHVTEDTLDGGKISTAEAVKVRVDLKQVTTSSSNSKVVKNIYGDFLLKEEAVFSPFLRGYIHKAEAVQASDGSYLLKANLKAYEAKLASKKINKAKVAVAAVTARVAVAA